VVVWRGKIRVEGGREGKMDWVFSICLCWEIVWFGG
jgi:hypothetical protein